MVLALLTAWTLAPIVVNDVFSQQQSSVYLPAATFQAPFFDPNADPAVNYGAAGLMAHELTHALQDQYFDLLTLPRS
jgi:predicted metalloendopeptidase